MTSSADVIILSSSPNPPQRTPTKAAYNPETLFGISPPAATPPSLPSPSELFQLPSRSRFFPTPSVDDDATKEKGRRNTKAAGSNHNDKDAPITARQKAKKAMMEPKPGVLGDLEPGSLDSRNNIAKKSAVSQKGRSKSSAKGREQGDMTLAGKVTKSGNESSTKNSSKSGTKTSAARESSPEKPEQAGSRKPNAPEKDEDLHLDEATRRRMDWTPPTETTSKGVPASDDNDDLANDNDKRARSGFGKLLSDYSCSVSSSGTRNIASNAGGGGLTKRRRIELVDPQVYPPPSTRSGVNDGPSGQEEDSSSSGAQVKKKAKSKKRFTTLTARMTAQYTHDVGDNDSMDAVVPDIGKAKSGRGKAKMADKEPEFIVLSPEAAAKTLDDQDLIFGTCSQLEREDSPETLREMQQAIRESESLVSQERERNSRTGSAEVTCHQSTSIRSVSRLTGARNLWGIAARDTEGSLVQAKNFDTVNLTGITQASKAKDDTTVETPAGSLEDDWFELDYGKPPPPAGKKTTLSEKLSNPAVETQTPVSADIMTPIESAQPAVTSDQQRHLQQPSMPHYEGFTDAELSKQVATFGFKSVRGRKKMIELLQKCWGSKHGTGSKEAQTQPRPSSQPDPRPAASIQAQADTAAAQTASHCTKIRPKGKPKSKQRTSQSAKKGLAPSTTPSKGSQRASKTERPPPPSFIDVEEIQDSEEETFLSPSQVQRRYTEMLSKAPSSAHEPSLKFLPNATPQSPTKRKAPASKTSRAPKPLPSSTAKPSTTELSKRSSLPDLSIQITKAVRAQPKLSSLSSSLGSRSRPTWHEKILMYDPIVLEDFTTWLNVEGLGLVGEDREVGTATVREWCESKGICCCWKKNASW